MKDLADCLSSQPTASWSHTELALLLVFESYMRHVGLANMAVISQYPMLHTKPKAGVKLVIDGHISERQRHSG